MQTTLYCTWATCLRRTQQTKGRKGVRGRWEKEEGLSRGGSDICMHCGLYYTTTNSIQHLPPSSLARFLWVTPWLLFSYTVGVLPRLLRKGGLPRRVVVVVILERHGEYGADLTRMTIETWPVHSSNMIGLESRFMGIYNAVRSAWRSKNRLRFERGSIVFGGFGLFGNEVDSISELRGIIKALIKQSVQIGNLI